jgi:hypothetical protein
MTRGNRIIRHEYFLRPDFHVVLELPEDMSAHEASRLSAYVATLAFNTAGSSDLSAGSTAYAKTWHNGSPKPTGAGYGVKIPLKDRKRLFIGCGERLKVYLEGRDEPVEVNIAKKSFWTPTCGELIHVEIGKWMIERGVAEWPPRKPHRLCLRKRADGGFDLSLDHTTKSNRKDS